MIRNFKIGDKIIIISNSSKLGEYDKYTGLHCIINDIVPNETYKCELYIENRFLVNTENKLF